MRYRKNIQDIVGELNTTVITIVGGMLVALVIRLVSKIADRRKIRSDDRKDALAEHLQLRIELREELDIVKLDLKQLQTDVDEWRDKYYHQIEINTGLQTQVEALRSELAEYYKNASGENPIL